MAKEPMYRYKGVTFYPPSANGEKDGEALDREDSFCHLGAKLTELSSEGWTFVTYHFIQEGDESECDSRWEILVRQEVRGRNRKICKVRSKR